ncbi:MAG: protein-disulfide reductase DsbD domain-containing protein [Phycisphaerales bacterium JB043]
MRSLSFRTYIVSLIGATLAHGIAMSCASAQAPSSPFQNIANKDSQQQADNVQVELIADTTHLVPGRVHRLGIVLTMKDGWHTYWANPGDTGTPTTIVFDLAEELNTGPVLWPAPERYIAAEGMIVDYVYTDTVVLQVPVFVDPATPTGQRITLEGRVEWLECNDVCIPRMKDIDITLPVADTTTDIDTRTAELFAASDARLPVRASKSATLSTSWNGNTLIVSSPGAERISVYPLQPTHPSPIDVATDASVDSDTLTLSWPDTLPKGASLTLVVEVEGGPEPGVYGVLVGTDPRLKTVSSPTQTTSDITQQSKKE